MFETQISTSLAAMRVKEEIRRIEEEVRYITVLLGDDTLFSSVLVGGMTMMAFGLVLGTGMSFLGATTTAIGAYLIITLATLRAAPCFSGRARLTEADIGGALNKIPTEQFVLDDEIKSCAPETLVEMIKRRQIELDEINCAWTNKNALVETLRRRRKYNEACCICFEQFEQGDGIRVLRCAHEFHLACLDKWAYSFASKRAHNCVSSYDPSCPLCKAVLLQEQR